MLQTWTLMNQRERRRSFKNSYSQQQQKKFKDCFPLKQKESWENTCKPKKCLIQFVTSKYILIIFKICIFIEPLTVSVPSYCFLSGLKNYLCRKTQLNNHHLYGGRTATEGSVKISEREHSPAHWRGDESCIIWLSTIDRKKLIFLWRKYNIFRSKEQSKSWKLSLYGMAIFRFQDSEVKSCQGIQLVISSAIFNLPHIRASQVA